MTGQERANTREYQYLESASYPQMRREYPVIMNWIRPGESVIDLGCGDGSLIYRIKDELKCEVAGLEASESGAQIAKSKGLDVTTGRIDVPLNIENKKYDVAVCNVTVQMVMYPEVLINEMLRIAKRAIISFPNFANHKNRRELLFCGRMPRAMLYDYSWYDTGHIHQLSIKDFSDYCKDSGIKLQRCRYLPEKVNFIKRLLIRAVPNLFAEVAIVEIRR